MHLYLYSAVINAPPHTRGNALSAHLYWSFYDECIGRYSGVSGVPVLRVWY